MTPIQLTLVIDNPVHEILTFNCFGIVIAVIWQLVCEWFDRKNGTQTISRKVMTIVVIFTLMIINTLWIGVTLVSRQA